MNLSYNDWSILANLNINLYFSLNHLFKIIILIIYFFILKFDNFHNLKKSQNSFIIYQEIFHFFKIHHLYKILICYKLV